MIQHGFVRVAAAVPRLRVADCGGNVAAMLELLDRAEQQQVHVLVFPELSLTGYTCGDLFQQPTMLRGAQDALLRLTLVGMDRFARLAVVCLPWTGGDQLFNFAAVFHRAPLLATRPN